MKRIYISIPMAGHDLARQRQKADMVKAKLSRSGWTPVNPFEIYAGDNPSYEDYMAADIRALLECDAIYMCEGWESSVGCSIEHAVAREYSRRRQMKFIYENNTEHEQYRYFYR